MTMTPEEFERAVYEIYGNYPDIGAYDEEVAHARTDRLMEEILIELGYQDGIERIRKATRWYA